MIGSAGPGKTTLCEMSVNIWQCWSWKDNFVLCIEMSVNDWE